MRVHSLAKMKPKSVYVDHSNEYKALDEYILVANGTVCVIGEFISHAPVFIFICSEQWRKIVVINCDVL